jgi:hypothetical protein
MFNYKKYDIKNKLFEKMERIRLLDDEESEDKLWFNEE